MVTWTVNILQDSPTGWVFTLQKLFIIFPYDSNRVIYKPPDWQHP